MSVDSDVVERLRVLADLVKRSAEFLEKLAEFERRFPKILSLKLDTLVQLQAVLPAERLAKVYKGLLIIAATYERYSEKLKNLQQASAEEIEDIARNLKEAAKEIEEGLQGV